MKLPLGLLTLGSAPANVRAGLHTRIPADRAPVIRVLRRPQHAEAL